MNSRINDILNQITDTERKLKELKIELAEAVIEEHQGKTKEVIYETLRPQEPKVIPEGYAEIVTVVFEGSDKEYDYLWTENYEPQECVKVYVRDTSKIVRVVDFGVKKLNPMIVYQEAFDID